MHQIKSSNYNRIIICEIRFKYKNQIEKNKYKIYLDMDQSSTRSNDHGYLPRSLIAAQASGLYGYPHETLILSEAF